MQKSASLGACGARCWGKGFGLSDRNRTCDPQLRRLLLYPTELRTVSKNKKGPDGPLMLSALAGLKEWSERRDSNSRPSAPKADALPGCATLRHADIVTPDQRDLGGRAKFFAPACPNEAPTPKRVERAQLPRVTGMCTSPGISKCLANSNLASELWCTSSGPSAKRSVR